MIIYINICYIYLIFAYKFLGNKEKHLRAEKKTNIYIYIYIYIYIKYIYDYYYIYRHILRAISLVSLINSISTFVGNSILKPSL